MEYLEFELRLGAGTGPTYPISVVHSPAGEVSATLRLAQDDAVFQARLRSAAQIRSSSGGTRKAGSADRHLAPTPSPAPPASSAEPDAELAKRIGQQLFEAVLPPPIEACYRTSLVMARQLGKGLRLRLRVEAPALETLPWEFLYDAVEREFVGLNLETPVTRYPELARPQPPLAVQPPVRILAMIASPSDLPLLDVQGETQRIEAAIDHLADAGSMQLTWLKGQTWRDLQAAMRQGPWHVFHFIGHGGFSEETGEGLIALAGDDGRAHHLTATLLGRLLAGHPSLRLAVLNACEGARASGVDLYSSLGAVLTQRGIAAVVSMQYEITDQAALEFSRMFYDALADGLPVDAALTEARKSISLAMPGSSEWATPVLHMRAPDGRLFQLDVAGAIFGTGRQETGPTATTSAGSLATALASSGAVESAPAAGSVSASTGASTSASAAAAASAVLPTSLTESATSTVAGATTTPAKAMAAVAEDDVRRGLLILLGKVRQYWIQGVLEKSVFQAAMLDIGMAFQQEAVDSPWGSVLQRPDASGETLEVHQTMGSVLEDVGGSLLVLGEPGSGKTTTLLTLARDLLAVAESSPNRPVPVVFNLSSWNDSKLALVDWLIRELSVTYGIPKLVSRGWLTDNRLMPLLDGLDEVKEDRRVACVAAINTFLQGTAVAGAVVCCRTKEYLALPPDCRLQLNAAVSLKPLSEAQIQAYLTAAGPPLAGLCTLLGTDSALRIEARSPLMLSLMIRAYHGLSAEQLATEGVETTAARRARLMEAYVTRMFRRAAEQVARG